MNDTPIMVLRDLEVRYKTGFSVGPVNASLDAGVYCWRGGNGSGKTSLLRTLCGEMAPYRGACEVLGEDTWRHAPARRHVGYVPATPSLPGFLRIDEAWRLVASLRGAPDWDGERFREQLGLDGAMQVSHASSGQRRRAELLAALAGDPSVLLLDEVFTNLDAPSRKIIASWFDSWRTSRVIILTGHRELPLEVDVTWDVRPGEPLEWSRAGEESPGAESE